MGINLANLRLIREHLFWNVKPEDFDMTVFNKFELEDKKLRINEPADCKTVGCIIGHSVVLDRPLLEKCTEVAEHFTNYTLWSEMYLDIQSTDPIWHYLFSERWAEIAPSKTSALERIDYVLQNNGDMPTLEQLEKSYPKYCRTMFTDEIEEDDIWEDLEDVEELTLLEQLKSERGIECTINHHTTAEGEERYSLTASDGTTSELMNGVAFSHFINGFAMCNKIYKEWT